MLLVVTIYHAKYKSIALTLSLALITLHLALRKEIGADWNAYEELLGYAQTKTLAQLTSNTEVFFAIVAKVSNLFSDHDMTVFIIITAIVSMVTLASIVRHCSSPLVAVVILYPYFIVICMQGYVRQTLATLLFAWVLQNRHKYSVAAANTLATCLILVHKSSVILLPFMLVIPRRPRLLKWQLILIACLGIAALFLQLDQMIFAITSYFLDSMTSNGALLRLVLTIFLLLLPLLHHEPQDTANREYLYIGFAIAGVCGALIITGQSTVADRLVITALMLSALFNAQNTPSTKKGQLKLGLFLFLLGAAQLVIFQFFAFNTHNFMPYSSILES